MKTFPFLPEDETQRMSETPYSKKVTFQSDNR